MDRQSFIAVMKKEERRLSANLEAIRNLIFSYGEKCDSKNLDAVSLGKRGGSVGGVARAKSLSKERRVEIAKKAAKARWTRDTDNAK